MDMISLFPQETWNNRPNGLRKDLVQKLYDLKPGFLRFPGGCIVEGRNLAERYQWKKT
jgi:alpha-N-arabinofuranosidase